MTLDLLLLFDLMRNRIGRANDAGQGSQKLVREPGGIADRTFEISFDPPGVEAYCFTFG